MRNGESMHPSNRRPEHIEREIEATRSRMESTLTSLEANLTRGQIFDRAFGYVRSMSGDTASKMGHGLWSQAKGNPLAFALIGAGAAWWMFGGGREKEVVSRKKRKTIIVRQEPTYVGYEGDIVDRTAAEYPIEPSYAGDFGLEDQHGKPGIKDRAKEAAHRVSEKAEDIKHKASDRAQHLRDRAEGATHRAKSTGDGARDRAFEARTKAHEVRSRAASTVRGAASSFKEKASGLGQGAKSRVNGFTSGAKTRANDMSRSMRTAYGRAASTGRSAAYKAKDRASRAREDMSGQMREHPFVFAGIALAFGAAVGSLLKPTRREDRLLGPRRDQLIEQVDEYGARGIQRAREVASHAIEAAEHEALEGQGPLEAEAVEAETSGQGNASSTFTQTTTTKTTIEPGASAAAPDVPETRDRMPRPDDSRHT